MGLVEKGNNSERGISVRILKCLKEIPKQSHTTGLSDTPIQQNEIRWCLQIRKVYAIDKKDLGCIYKEIRTFNALGKSDDVDQGFFVFGYRVIHYWIDLRLINLKRRHVLKCIKI